MLSDEQKKFAHNYNNKRKSTKKWGPILLMLIVAILISNTQVQKANQTTNPINQTQTQIIKTAIENFLLEPTDQNIEIVAIQGPKNITENTIQSNNNIIVWNGRTLPRNSAIINTQPLQPIQYFNNPEYDIDTLRIHINTILSPGVNMTHNRHNNNTIHPSGMKHQFDIQCMTHRIHSPLCERNINNFLHTFHTFDIANHKDELAQIAQNIHNPNQLQIYCQNLIKHIQYNGLFDQDRSSAIQTCDTNHKNNYQLGKHLAEINNEFINNNFSTTIYNNPTLNNYKTISLAQTIIQDIENNNINIRRIEAYNNQLQALLRNPQIDAIYRDIHYWVINQIIVPRLAEQRRDNRLRNQITTQLLSLNRPNTLLQRDGIQDMVTNTQLIQTIEENMQTRESNVENIIQGINTLPYIQINDTIIESEQITLQGELHIIDTLNNTIQTPFLATGIIELNRLIINSITLNEYQLFTQILNTFIEDRNITLPGLYSYISENIALYQPQTNQDICNQIEQINTFTINICNPGLIQGTQIRGNQEIAYKISIQANTIADIQTSDPNLTTYLQEIYQGRITDTIRIGSLIQEIILTHPEQETEITQANEDIILVANTFQNLFGIQANDIVYIQNTYYIEFEADSIRFVIAYNKQNRILGPLFFRDVLVNDRPLRTQRTTTAESENRQTLQRFATNPIHFIQEVDTFTYEIYLQFK